MPAINLPNGQSAILYSRDEVSERTARKISRAYMKAAGTAAKLTNLGFDEKNPETWTIFSNISDEDQNNLDLLTTGEMVTSATGNLPDSVTCVFVGDTVIVAGSLD